MNITAVMNSEHDQVVQLPDEMRLPQVVKQVEVRARGVDRIISPAGRTWDEFFRNGPRASDDYMADRAG